MLFNKKASLEISIQAIVIIVLAMTLLGLGLGFIRNQFRTISETAGQVQEQVKQQILDDLRSGNKKLSFPTNEVIIGKKESIVLAIGVKNTKSADLKFSISVKKIDSISGARSNPDETDGVFIYNKGLQTLSVNNAGVHPIRYTAQAATGTDTFEIVICDCGESATSGCSDTSSNACSGEAEEYDAKTFFITTT